MVVPGSIPNMMRSVANFRVLLKLLTHKVCFFASMISMNYKAKQFLVSLLKIIIVCGAFYFIYDQLANNEQLDWDKFLELLDRKKSFWGILFILSFSFFNRYFEILKWQNLVSSFQTINVATATEQVLSALTAGLFTPNGIGEYAGKALYFEKSKAATIVFLNLICNGIQLILTIVFGTIGLIYLGFYKWVLIIAAIVTVVFVVYFFFKKITIKGYSLETFVKKINEIPKSIHHKNILLAIGRYLIFSHQYYFLFLAFDVDVPYFTLMATITAVYFLASSLPTFQFLDFAVKGSVSLFFFGLIGVNEWVIIFISTLMWFLNIVIPVAIGSIYVLKFKSRWK